MKRDAQGFSLIELLVVVAIILIIAAIAIPNFLRSRIAANQASAVQSLRMITTAETSYASTYNIGYAQALSNLGPPTSGDATSAAAGLIDSVLASGLKSGYNFAYSSGPVDTSGKINTYQVNADPISSATGTIYYYTDNSGVIRQNATVTAGSTDSAIAG
jgi:prepilin-type N-terminal cleavage/methylation domain-containing protein